MSGALTPSGTNSEPRPSISNASPDLNLFLRNLRLLDLDKLKDWPDLTVETYSKTSDVSLQRNRVRGTEWALYRLFELWDKKFTLTQLNKYFPALVPLQSINLRGALYRGLDELKQTGILGRECGLRKTTLDDCRGPKFEEILMLFSTVVLKRTFSERPVTNNVSTPSRKVAYAAALHEEDNANFQPLILAQKKFLNSHIRSRNQDADCILSLDRTLTAKQTCYTTHRQTTLQQLAELRARSASVSLNIPAIQDLLHDEFPDGDPWLSLILTVDPNSGTDTLLETPFDKMWLDNLSRANNTHATSSPVPPSPDSSATTPTLLTEMQARLAEQATRLQTWRAFQDKLGARMQILAQTPRKSPSKSARPSPLKSPSKSPRKSPLKGHRVVRSIDASLTTPRRMIASESAHRLAQVTQQGEVIDRSGRG